MMTKDKGWNMHCLAVMECVNSSPSVWHRFLGVLGILNIESQTSVRKYSNISNNTTVNRTPIDEFTKTTSITRSGLKIVRLNIHSLRNTAHIVQQRYLEISSNIDVLTISETWLNTKCVLILMSALQATICSDLIAFIKGAAAFAPMFGKN